MIALKNLITGANIEKTFKGEIFGEFPEYFLNINQLKHICNYEADRILIIRKENYHFDPLKCTTSCQH